MDTSETETPAGPILPAHIDETVQAIARLHARHRQDATGLQRAVEALTGLFGRPRAAALLALAALGWIALNALLKAAGRTPPDPPPFPFLAIAVSLTALLMTVFILITQRREDELGELREQLTLELAILAEQKSAKTIELIEELRKDLPSVRNRSDAQAQALAKPADPEAVLEALKENRTAATDQPPQA